MFPPFVAGMYFKVMVTNTNIFQDNFFLRVVKQTQTKVVFMHGQNFHAAAFFWEGNQPQWYQKTSPKC